MKHPQAMTHHGIKENISLSSSASPSHCQSHQVLQLEESRWTEVQPGLAQARDRHAIITVEDNPCVPLTGSDDNGGSGRYF